MPLTLQRSSPRCPEALFQPSLGGFGEKGLGDLIKESNKRLDADLFKTVLGNVVLSGVVRPIQYLSAY